MFTLHFVLLSNGNRNKNEGCFKDKYSLTNSGKIPEIILNRMISHTPLLQIDITILILHFCAWPLLYASDKRVKDQRGLVYGLFLAVSLPLICSSKLVEITPGLFKKGARVQVQQFLYHQQHAQRDSEMHSVSAKTVAIQRKWEKFKREVKESMDG